ncbi:MAG: CBS domain-containing protein [Actinomycetota bacterium]
MGELIQRGTVSVRISATLQEAAERMARDEVGALAVLNDSQDIVGIVTERDIVRAVADENEEVDDLRCGDVMAVDLAVVASDATVADAAEAMIDGAVRHLPVVDDDGPVGLLSIRDVAAVYRAALD